MKRFLIHIGILMFFVTATGCSCSQSSMPPEKRLRRIAPEVAEAACAEADTLVMIAGDNQALADRLLYLRATLYNVEQKYGPQVADDFETVFTERVTTLNDSLARMIF